MTHSGDRLLSELLDAVRETRSEFALDQRESLERAGEAALTLGVILLGRWSGKRMRKRLVREGAPPWVAHTVADAHVVLGIVFGNSLSRRRQDAITAKYAKLRDSENQPQRVFVHGPGKET